MGNLKRLSLIVLGIIISSYSVLAQEAIPKLKYTYYAVGLIVVSLIVGWALSHKTYKPFSYFGPELPSLNTVWTFVQLKGFCKKKIDEGYSKGDIMNAASESGWDEADIKKVLKDL